MNSLVAILDSRGYEHSGDNNCNRDTPFDMLSVVGVDTITGFVFNLTAEEVGQILGGN